MYKRQEEIRATLINLFEDKIVCADCGRKLYFHRKRVDKHKDGAEKLSDTVLSLDAMPEDDVKSDVYKRQDCLMGVGKDDPFLAVDMLILVAVVDGVQRPSENGISDVMCIIQNGSQ